METNKKTYSPDVISDFIKSQTHPSEFTKYAGLNGMIEKLSQVGEMLTTIKSTDVWTGGVGNFIKTTEVPDAFGVYRWVLNYKITKLDTYKNWVNSNINEIQNEIEVLRGELKRFTENIEIMVTNS